MSGLLLMATASVLVGCAQDKAIFVAENGATIINLDQPAFTYARPGVPSTLCRFNRSSAVFVCDNGRKSGMTSAGLPTIGTQLIYFDGSEFRRKAPKAN